MKYVLAVAALTAVLFGVGWKPTALKCEPEPGTCEPPNPFNRVTNPSFEDMSIDNHIPDDWVGNDLTGSDGQDCTTASAGSCSLVIHGHGANKAKSVTQHIDVAGFAVEACRIMVDVKSEGKAQGFPTFGVSYNHADGTFDSFTFAAEGGFHDWQQYIGDYVVTQDYVSIDYTLTFGGAEHVWYDNVVLIPCVGVTG